MPATVNPQTTRAGRARWHRYLPPEHGAWAMLLLPYVAGTSLVGWSWTGVLLLIAWLLGYLVAYYGTHWLVARRKERFVAPLTLYLALLVVVGGLLLSVEPGLALAVVAFLPFVAVNVHYARQRRPRAWQNGVASATAACLMAPVAYASAGGTERATAIELFAVTWLYFAGSVWYVKSMLRERGNPRYRTASIAFHICATVVAVTINAVLAAFFALLLLRAVVLPGRQLRPAQVGAIEIVNCCLLLGLTLLVL